MTDASACGVVSVIVPCWNVDPFVEQCLLSVLAQSYRQLEVVVIDDGSTDGTSARIDVIAGSDDRIRVVRQANAGLGAARNVGVDVANGEFLFFLDGDDWLPVAAIEGLVDSLQASGSDFSTGAVDRVGTSSRWRSPMHAGTFDDDVRATHISRMPELLRDHLVCGKLFRRAFWERERLRFPSGVLFEDMVLATRAHLTADAVDIVSSTSYCWRVRESGPASITQDRARPDGVTARFDALIQIDAALRGSLHADLRADHLRKVIRNDIPLYLDVAAEADEDVRRICSTAMRSFVHASTGVSLRRLSCRDRLVLDVVRDGDDRRSTAIAALLKTRAGRPVTAFASAVRRLGLGFGTRAVRCAGAELGRGAATKLSKLASRAVARCASAR